MKGTPSKGKRNKTLHIACRRCGRITFHKKKAICSSCGYGKSARLKTYNWTTNSGNKKK
ncbi:50S ribosomal protein L37e [Candidatus Woesearchaeota archaeon]|nr:MAG: 50S ribosomal protein L37e [Candidatus Woesearchaeota archaeon]